MGNLKNGGRKEKITATINFVIATRSREDEWDENNERESEGGVKKQ